MTSSLRRKGCSNCHPPHVEDEDGEDFGAGRVRKMDAAYSRNARSAT
jgi:hypothetical protein